MSEYGPAAVFVDVVDGKKIRVTHVNDTNPKAFMARMNTNTLRLRRCFIYLDVGQWGQDKHNFAVAFGDGKTTEVLLCNVTASAAGSGVAAHFPQLESLVNYPSLKGTVQLLRRIWTREVRLNTKGKVYFFLPDTHFPVVAKHTDDDEVKKIPRRFTSGVAKKLDRDLPVGPPEDLWDRITDFSGTLTDKRWKQLYEIGDIFGAAGGALGHTLFALEDFCAPKPETPLHLVQLGDMYEFWIGLDRLFAETKEFKVRLLDESVPGIVDKWTAATHMATTVYDERVEKRVSLPQLINQCRVSRKTFLSGNHDNYLRKLSGIAPGGLPKRSVGYLADGIHMEHGHMGDPWNRDGVGRGHAVTNLVFLRGIIRKGDPPRRDQYLRYGAYKTVMKGAGVGMFVMAHTHKPFMAPVYVRT